MTKEPSKGAVEDGAFYSGETVTEGFTGVRQAGESISVLFYFWKMAVSPMATVFAVQYSGAGGRDPLFLAENFIPVIFGASGSYVRG